MAFFVEILTFGIIKLDRNKFIEFRVLSEKSLLFFFYFRGIPLNSITL